MPNGLELNVAGSFQVKFNINGIEQCRISSNNETKLEHHDGVGKADKYLDFFGKDGFFLYSSEFEELTH